MWRLLLGTMGVKSLVQGLNAAATAGFEPRTVWSEVRRRNRLATAPPLTDLLYSFLWAAIQSGVVILENRHIGAYSGMHSGSRTYLCKNHESLEFRDDRWYQAHLHCCSNWRLCVWNQTQGTVLCSFNKRPNDNRRYYFHWRRLSKTK